MLIELYEYTIGPSYISFLSWIYISCPGLLEFIQFIYYYCSFNIPQVPQWQNGRMAKLLNNGNGRMGELDGFHRVAITIGCDPGTME